MNQRDNQIKFLKSKTLFKNIFASIYLRKKYGNLQKKIIFVPNLQTFFLINVVYISFLINMALFQCAVKLCTTPTLILTIRVSMAASSSRTCLLISCLPSLSPPTTSLKRSILFFRLRTLTNPSILPHKHKTSVMKSIRGRERRRGAR